MLNILRLIGPANPTLWEPCDNGHAKPGAKESRLYGYHGTLAAKRKVSCLCVCECVCASFMWVTTACLMAPCCVQRPALSCSLLSLSYTQTNPCKQRGRFWGVPHPNTLHNTPPLHLLLLFSKLKVDQWSASMSLLSAFLHSSSLLITSFLSLTASSFSFFYLS